MADQLQAFADRAAIIDLVHRYLMGLAQGDPDAIVSVFAPDAHLDHDFVQLDGSDAIRRHFAESRTTGKSGTGIGLDVFHGRHPMLGNVVVDLDGERAHVESRGIIVHHGERSGRGYLVVRSIAYSDDCARLADGWKITRRRHPPPAWTIEFESDDPRAAMFTADRPSGGER